MTSPETFRPAISMVATAKRRTTVLDLACQAETLGFAGIACPSLGAAMAFCVSLAHVTKTIKFWTSIQPIYYSHAIEMANTAAHIHEVSNSRFGLGLGVSHGPVINRLGATTATPLADIKTYVETMRAQERFSGELPPIYLAALRNKMLDLATEVSQGAIWANAALSNISAQLSRITAPNRAEKFFANMVPTVISDDLAAAHEIHRKTLVGYVSLPNYRNYWRSCGYGEQIDAFEKILQSPNKETRSAEIISAMDTQWLNDCTISGDSDTVREALWTWSQAGVLPIAVMSSTSGGQAKAIGELFAAYGN
ncbi:MAG: LLM class flavin-dependent oxidoreductase, partial [Actinomycetota bacterium]|nr:LLM class flavin-dependent oxidoreductase [Actinomycetota bacterium]MDA2955675.1 LLM class flavin-dependent oxidoreductase [Actinomycetota bacterium]